MLYLYRIKVNVIGSHSVLAQTPTVKLSVMQKVLLWVITNYTEVRRCFFPQREHVCYVWSQWLSFFRLQLNWKKLRCLFLTNLWYCIHNQLCKIMVQKSEKRWGWEAHLEVRQSTVQLRTRLRLLSWYGLHTEPCRLMGSVSGFLSLPSTASLQDVPRCLSK